MNDIVLVKLPFLSQVKQQPALKHFSFWGYIVTAIRSNLPYTIAFLPFRVGDGTFLSIVSKWKDAGILW
jgi:hypothetical protein